MPNRLTAAMLPRIELLPFWQAKYYSPGLLTEARAVVWHFAEGYSTDSWLTHPTNDNSSHLIVKRNGAVRQMVDFDDASHSLHVARTDREVAGDYGIFSLAAARHALGAGIGDPNRYLFAIEIEGFAKDGPNADQVPTITALALVLERLFPKVVHLGHRDFQDEKPCPGPTLFRALLPHGRRLTIATPIPTPQEIDVSIYTRRDTGGRFIVKAGSTPIGYRPKADGSGWEPVKTWAASAQDSSASFDYMLARISGTTAPGGLLHVPDGFFAGLFVSSAEVDETVATTKTYTQVEVDALTHALVDRLEAERTEDATAAASLRQIADAITR